MKLDSEMTFPPPTLHPFLSPWVWASPAQTQGHIQRHLLPWVSKKGSVFATWQRQICAPSQHIWDGFVASRERLGLSVLIWNRLITNSYSRPWAEPVIEIKETGRWTSVNSICSLGNINILLIYSFFLRRFPYYWFKHYSSFPNFFFFKFSAYKTEMSSKQNLQLVNYWFQN